MGRTWLLRGVAVAVFAVLVGAWAVGVVGLGDTPPAPARQSTRVSDDSSRAPDDRGPILREKSRHDRDSDQTEDAVTDPSPVNADEPLDEDPATPAPTSTGPDPDDPSEVPSDPPPPSHTPSTPPSQPSDDCTDLPAIVDCVLDPITGRP
jgi:hypothetical protein